MKFILIDTILEQSPEHIRAVKQVTLAEEYLADHFPTFPVLPGVMMVEAMVQAARRMLADRGDVRLVLGEVKAMTFGSFVKPGEAMEIRVSLKKQLDDGSYLCQGSTSVLHQGSQAGSGEIESSRNETAAKGRFTMRPVRPA